MKLREKLNEWKNKECKNLLMRCIQLLMFSNVAKWVMSVVLFIVGAAGIFVFPSHTAIYQVSLYVHLSAFVYPIIYFAIAIYFAWIAPVIKWLKGTPKQ